LLPQSDYLKLMAGAWNGKAGLIDQTGSGLGKVDDHLLDWFEGGAAIESDPVIQEPEKQFFFGLGLGLDVENHVFPFQKDEGVSPDWLQG
jgi:hypothetical protein